MNQKMVWSINASLQFGFVRTSHLLKIPCRKCRTLLDMHQPCVDRPNQFLATCSHCGAWYRLETKAGEPRGMLVSLPEPPPFPVSEEAIEPTIV